MDENNQHYQKETDFLESLYLNSEFLINKICGIVISLCFLILFLLLLILGPTVIKYEMDKHKGLIKEYPIVFEVNGESYPDIKNLSDFDNNSINLDTVPVEEN